MRHVMLVALLAPFPVQASELWCMPTEICRNDTCKPTNDEESSVRLTDPDGSASLRAHAESIAMTKTYDGPVQQWEGLNKDGAAEILAVRRSDMEFTHLELRSDGSQRTATGLCEVQ